MSKEIGIVDFGSQTTHLIGRRFRQLGIGVRYYYPEETQSCIQNRRLAGIVLSGGPASVYEPGAPQVDPEILNRGIPVLGICYGWQWMAKELGGQVEACSKEYGPQILTKKINHPLLDIPKMRSKVWLSHGDSVTKLPQGFDVIGSTAGVINTAVVDDQRKLYGVQFHPEVKHTEYGLEILRNFAEKILGLTLNPIRLDPEKLVTKIRNQVGNKRVIGAVSGGVDSTVAAFLIAKAIGANFIPVHVDSGLMRPGTTELVRDIFSNHVQADLRVINAKDRFMEALSGLTDPEEKRKAVGRLYVEIFQEEANLHPDADFLAQGTIYSDVIESKGSKHASRIKSHHNVGGLPEGMKLKLLEPLRGYYKDEVRELGRLAGLPDELVNQQPFPGPGYAVRIRGEVTEARLQQVMIADSIVVEEMKKHGLYDQVFQCFAVMTGAESTAVKGDARVFAEVVAVRAYESDDVMTSDWSYPPRELLQSISTRIVNEVPDVSRVVYDISTKPPATMEWE